MKALGTTKPLLLVTACIGKRVLLFTLIYSGDLVKPLYMIRQ